MYECSSCSNTYAWPQSLQRHIKNKHNAKDDETVLYEKDITSPKSSDNITPAAAIVNQSISANTVSTSPSYPYRNTLSPVHMDLYGAQNLKSVHNVLLFLSFNIKN